MTFSRSLKWRLILAMIAVFALGGGNVLIYLYGLDKDLRQHVFKEQVDTLLAGRPIQRDGSTVTQLPLRFSESDWRYSLYEKNQRLIASAPVDEPALEFRDPVNGSTTDHQPITARQVDGGNILVIARSDWAECEELCRIFRERVTGGSVLFVALTAFSALAVIGLANWMLTSVKKAAVLAGTIGVDNPRQRLPAKDLPLEIEPLANSVNDALERLMTAYERERQFTADAAHELRTPLAVLSLRLQGARQDANIDWTNLNRDLAQMQRLVEQLLVLARADSRDAVTSPVSAFLLPRLVRETVAEIIPLFERDNRTLNVDLIENVEVNGEPLHVRQAIYNVLENALRHGTGNVNIVLTTLENEAWLDVLDEGASVSAHDRNNFFLRFYKGNQGALGSGLGLAIVRQLLLNLGGDASIIADEKFRIRLTMPRSSGNSSVRE